MRQENSYIIGFALIIYCFALGIFLGYIYLEQHLWVWLSAVLSVVFSAIVTSIILVIVSKKTKDKNDSGISKEGIIVLFIFLLCVTALTPFAYSSIQENKAIIAKENHIRLKTHQEKIKSKMCSDEEKRSAREVRSMLESFGKRDDNGSSVHYIWTSGWYSLDYDKQLGMMQAIADTEFCLSDGKRTIFRIEYAGETVAQATPTGGAQVIKSRP